MDSLPIDELESRGLLHRKGFPESYDIRRLIRFLADVKSGVPEALAPVYSHLRHDIVPGVYCRAPAGHHDRRRIERAADRRASGPARADVRLRLRLLIYVDAHESDIEQWAYRSLLSLRDTIFKNPSSYFHRYASLGREDAIETARGIWQSINLVNLRDNVLPTRERAHLILEKGRITRSAKLAPAETEARNTWISVV